MSEMVNKTMDLKKYTQQYYKKMNIKMWCQECDTQYRKYHRRKHMKSATHIYGTLFKERIQVDPIVKLYFN